MATSNNLVLQLLITAKDQASAVFSKVFTALNDSTNVIATKVREAFTGLFNITDEAQAFEAQLARVQSKSNASAEEMARLKQAALDMGRQMGVSAIDAAQGLEILTGAGLSVDQAISALGPTLRVMSTEQVSAADAAGALTDALALMGISLDQAGRAGDVLQAGADATSTSVMEMAEAMRGAGAAASNAGLTLEQTATILTAFAKYGLKGAEAGTALDNMLNLLIDPTSKARVELAKLGQTSGNVGEMIETLTRAGPRGSAAMLAFGEAQSGVNALLKTGVQGFAEYGAAIDASSGGLQKAADTIGNTTVGALGNLSAAWQQAKLALTWPLLEPIAQGAKALADQLGALANSGVLEKIGKGLAEVFVTGGQQVIDFLKKVDWDQWQTQALTTTASIKTALTEMVESVQGKVQTVADWTTTIFSPLTGAIDGYRMAWYLARGEQDKAAEVQARIDATSAAIGRALSGASGELQRNVEATQAKIATDQALNEAQRQQAVAQAAAQAEIAAMTEALKEGGLSAEVAAVYAQRLADAQNALAVAQGKTTAAASASVPVIGGVADATQGAATAATRAKDAADRYALSWGTTAEGLTQVTAAHLELGGGIADVVRVTGQSQAGMTEWNGALVKAHEGVTVLSGGLPVVAKSLTGVTEITKEYDRQIKAGINNAANWRSGMELNGVQLMGLRDAAQASAEKLAYLQSIQATLPDADRQIAAAKQASTQAENDYTQALAENITQAERAIEATRRATALDQTAIDLNIQQAQVQANLARAKGDTEEATRQENAATDLQIEKIQSAINGKNAEIDAYFDLIDAKQRQLEADGELDASDQAQLETMADTLEGLELERQGLEQMAKQTRELADAKKEAADRAEKAAEATKAAGDEAEKTTAKVEKLNIAFAKFGEQAAYGFGFQGMLEYQRVIQSIESSIAAANERAQQLAEDGLSSVNINAANAALQVESMADALENSESYLNDAARAAADNLRSALKSAREEAESLTASLSDLAEDFRREMLQIQGDQDALLELEHQDNLQRLEEMHQRAGAMSDQAYQDAKRQAEALHQLKLQQLREEEQANTATEKTRSSVSALADEAERAGRAMQYLSSANLTGLRDGAAGLAKTFSELNEVL